MRNAGDFLDDGNFLFVVAMCYFPEQCSLDEEKQQEFIPQLHGTSSLPCPKELNVHSILDQLYLIRLNTKFSNTIKVDCI